MALATQVTTFECPGCGRILEPLEPGDTRCPGCDWKGQAYLFMPLVPQVEKAAQALPDDAVCVHHPAKQAVAVCEGTGDFICSLCGIDLGGKTYSAQYLNKTNKEKLTKSFELHLDRPDRVIKLVFILSLCFSLVGVLLIPWAVYAFFKVIRLRKRDPIYRRVVGLSSAVACGIVTFLLSLGLAGGLIAIVIALVTS